MGLRERVLFIGTQFSILYTHINGSQDRIPYEEKFTVTSEGFPGLRMQPVRGRRPRPLVVEKFLTKLSPFLLTLSFSQNLELEDTRIAAAANLNRSRRFNFDIFVYS
jgi:hypothetical protein